MEITTNNVSPSIQKNMGERERRERGRKTSKHFCLIQQRGMKKDRKER